MQIRRVYKGVNPKLLYDEVREFILKQGTVLGYAKLETYALPNDSSSFITRGTLTFKLTEKTDESEKECVSAHIVGSAKGETKVILDVDEKLFDNDRLSAFQDDLDFIFNSYEARPH